MRRPASHQASPFSPRTFGFLVTEALSGIGSWATIVTVWGYAAYEYDATPGEISVFGVAFALPAAALGPVSGTIIDRFGPRATLAGAKVLGVAASLALLTVDTFVALAALSALHGIASALTQPALQAMPPRLVDQCHLARTNALVSLTDELAIVLGPVAAGVGIAAFGFRGAFVFDAATYAVGLLVLPLVRVRPVRPQVDDDGEAVQVRWRDALAGWRLIAGTGVLRRTVACTFAVNVLYGTAFLAEPLYVRDVLDDPPSTFAALQTVFGVFLVGGGVLVARLGERLATFGWVATGVGASGLFAVVYLGTPWVAVAFAGVALWGVATSAISGPSRTVLQRGSPEHAHGRVLAADLMASGVAILAGIALSGLLIDAFGVPWAIALLGSSVLGVAAWLQAAGRRERARPAPGDDEPRLGADLDPDPTPLARPA